MLSANPACCKEAENSVYARIDFYFYGQPIPYRIGHPFYSQ
ncbi:hypothetical protein QF000_001708 [Paraburkholderia atlantica]